MQSKNGAMTALRYPFEPDPMGRLPPDIAWAQRHQPVCPVHLPSGVQAWMVSRKDDARLVMSDPRFTRELAYAGAPRFVGEDFTSVRGSIINLDGPAHARLKSIIQPYYGKRAVERYLPIVERHAEWLLEAMSASPRPAELLQAYIAPLALMSSCEILNISPTLKDTYQSYFKSQVSVDESPEQVAAGAQAVLLFAREVIGEKRKDESADDVIVALTKAHDTGLITEEELVGTAALLLATSSETMVGPLSTGVVTLFRESDTLQECIADPGLWRLAVEEIIRYHNNGTLNFPRVAKQDVELHGVTVRAGEAVCVTLLGASWDPLHYEQPERFDIHRSTDANAAFGFGPHFCPGAALARAFMEKAYAMLFRRFPGLRLAMDPAEIVWDRSLVFTKPAAVMVAW